MAAFKYKKLNRRQQAKFALVMHEWGQGKLKRPEGDVIKDQKEAVAVAFSEARKVK